MAAAAVKVLESAVAETPTGPLLEVFERIDDDGVFAGVRRVDSSTAR